MQFVKQKFLLFFAKQRAVFLYPFNIIVLGHQPLQSIFRYYIFIAYLKRNKFLTNHYLVSVNLD